MSLFIIYFKVNTFGNMSKRKHFFSLGQKFIFHGLSKQSWNSNQRYCASKFHEFHEHK